MSKRTVFTTVTPLPLGVSRATVLETLHGHLEMIDLNLPFGNLQSTLMSHILADPAISCSTTLYTLSAPSKAQGDKVNPGSRAGGYEEHTE
jgi:hypothetical protein